MAGPSNQAAKVKPLTISTRNFPVKLQLDEYLAAYMERKVLVRDEHIPDWYEEDNKLYSIVTNYIIAQEIVRNFNWKERMVYRLVCNEWNSAVTNLKNPALRPVDFLLKNSTVVQSSKFTTEPLAVFPFIKRDVRNIANITFCRTTIPPCCNPPCKKSHLPIDNIHKLTTAPKECMVAVKIPSVMFVPLPHSTTALESVSQNQAPGFIGGIFIPSIPNVNFHKINLKNPMNFEHEYYTSIDRIVENQVIKGILIFVTIKFIEELTLDEISFLVKKKYAQPDIQYAIGGCLCHDTILGTSDINGVIDNLPLVASSGNLITVGVFSVPKDKEDETKFEMFSCIIESTKSRRYQIREDIAKTVDGSPCVEFIVLHHACYLNPEPFHTRQMMMQMILQVVLTS